jgi:predicted ABC-type ATPase
MPVLHLIVGPNGAGKTTFFDRLLSPITHLPFINADIIARQHWPDDADDHAYEAAELAELARNQAIADGRSFIAETVFSHPSKLDLIARAQAADYLVQLHVILVPEELSVLRVRLRAEQGGHRVPEDKIRARYQRLWSLVAQAIALADTACVYDNSNSRQPFRRIAQFDQGRALVAPRFPDWSPLKLE